ncbi:MAG: hypothetical protein IKC08_07870, partial [Lentisphaeria bacterium]|nr:hypothetical protein [Lentisphaeria bacterium]
MLNTYKKNPLFLSAFFLLLCFWAFTTFFTIFWDLPSHFTPETDGISPKLDLSAREMMKADTCKYPPLQYLIVSAFTGQESEKGLSSDELLHKRSRRIVIMRLVSSFMGLGTALILILAGIYILKLPLLYSLASGIFFLLLPQCLFYSRSTNMDMPAAFFFILSLFFAVLAEQKYGFQEENKPYRNIYKYISSSLAAGVCISCGFCTKDQLYSLYILPALIFFILKWKKEKSFLRAIFPFLLYGTAFIAAFILIYSLMGWDIFLPHFKWITTEGSTPYAATGSGFFSRFVLLPLFLQDLGKAMDFPLLLLFAVSIGLLLCKKVPAIWKERSFIYFAIFTLLILLSQFFFFCQVVRYSQIRYFLPVLPLLVLLCVYFLYYCRKNRFFLYSGVILLLLQGGIASEYLYHLNNSPLARLKKELDTAQIHKNMRINTGMAELGKVYLQKSDGTIDARKCIRPWGIFLGLERYGIRDIYTDDLSLFLAEPDIIIVKKENPGLAKYGFTLKGAYLLPVNYLPSLSPSPHSTELFLYAPGKKITRQYLTDFQ